METRKDDELHIVGIYNPRKRNENFPLMSYLMRVGMNAASDSSVDQEEMERLREEIMDQKNEKSTALERLRTMEWKRNQQEDRDRVRLQNSEKLNSREEEVYFKGTRTTKIKNKKKAQKQSGPSVVGLCVSSGTAGLSLASLPTYRRSVPLPPAPPPPHNAWEKKSGRDLFTSSETASPFSIADTDLDKAISASLETYEQEKEYHRLKDTFADSDSERNPRDIPCSTSSSVVSNTETSRKQFVNYPRHISHCPDMSDRNRLDASDDEDDFDEVLSDSENDDFHVKYNGTQQRNSSGTRAQQQNADGASTLAGRYAKNRDEIDSKKDYRTDHRSVLENSGFRHETQNLGLQNLGIANARTSTGKGKHQYSYRKQGDAEGSWNNGASRIQPPATVNERKLYEQKSVNELKSGDSCQSINTNTEHVNDNWDAKSDDDGDLNEVPGQSLEDGIKNQVLVQGAGACELPRNNVKTSAKDSACNTGYLPAAPEPDMSLACKRRKAKRDCVASSISNSKLQACSEEESDERCPSQDFQGDVENKKSVLQISQDSGKGQDAVSPDTINQDTEDKMFSPSASPASSTKAKSQVATHTVKPFQVSTQSAATDTADIAGNSPPQASSPPKNTVSSNTTIPYTFPQNPQEMMMCFDMFCRVMEMSRQEAGNRNGQAVPVTQNSHNHALGPSAQQFSPASTNPQIGVPLPQQLPPHLQSMIHQFSQVNVNGLPAQNRPQAEIRNGHPHPQLGMPRMPYVDQGLRLEQNTVNSTARVEAPSTGPSGSQSPHAVAPCPVPPGNNSSTPRAGMGPINRAPVDNQLNAPASNASSQFNPPSGSLPHMVNGGMPHHPAIPAHPLSRENAEPLGAQALPPQQPELRRREQECSSGTYQHPYLPVLPGLEHLFQQAASFNVTVNDRPVPASVQIIHHEPRQLPEGIHPHLMANSGLIHPHHGNAVHQNNNGQRMSQQAGRAAPQPDVNPSVHMYQDPLYLFCMQGIGQLPQQAGQGGGYMYPHMPETLQNSAAAHNAYLQQLSRASRNGNNQGIQHVFPPQQMPFPMPDMEQMAQIMAISGLMPQGNVNPRNLNRASSSQQPAPPGMAQMPNAHPLANHDVPPQGLPGFGQVPQNLQQQPNPLAFEPYFVAHPDHSVSNAAARSESSATGVKTEENQAKLVSRGRGRLRANDV